MGCLKTYILEGFTDERRSETWKVLLHVLLHGTRPCASKSGPKLLVKTSATEQSMEGSPAGDRWWRAPVTLLAKSESCLE